jgi:hypothetical protein
MELRLTEQYYELEVSQTWVYYSTLYTTDKIVANNGNRVLLKYYSIQIYISTSRRFLKDTPVPMNSHHGGNSKLGPVLMRKLSTLMHVWLQQMEHRDSI